MEKNVIIIWDKYESFVEGLKKYVESCGKGLVISIENIDEIHNVAYDYFLIARDFKNHLHLEDHRVYTLVDQLVDSENQKEISRFTSANQILHKLYAENSSSESKRVTLFSMAGGTGKSELARGICDGLLLNGCLSLYIDLSTDTGCVEQDIDLSLLTYYFHRHQEIPTVLSERIKEKLLSSKGVVSCTLNTPEDRVYLTVDVLESLIEWLATVSPNRWSIIESPWTYDEHLALLLRQSSYRVLLTDSRHSNDKCKKWIHNYQQLINNDKDFYCILNKSGKEILGDDILYVPTFDLGNVKKGMKQWANKYLMTHWMKR